MGISFVRDFGETAMQMAIVVALGILLLLSFNTFGNFMAIDHATILLVLAGVIATAGVAYSFADGVLTTMEVGFIAGAGIVLSFLYNLNVFTNELHIGILFVLSILFNISAVYLIIKNSRDG